jgi:beta-glucanase (GH16 family)
LRTSLEDIAGFSVSLPRHRQGTLRASGMLVFLAASLVFAGCNRSSEPVAQEWQLRWQDEFEGVAGESPNSTRWRFDIGTDWGNAQLEYDTDRPENVSLDGNGHLVITAREESYMGSSYTSGRINTRNLFEQERGRFEARIQLPEGQGIWPAFWLLGANFEEAGWPACGEIDIMEYLGQDPETIYGSLHGPGFSGGSAVVKEFVLPGGEGFHEAFHVFAVEWDAREIVWSVDGNVFQTVSVQNLPPGGSWVYDHPFFIILNVAVGGHWPGPPDATTNFPQSMLVDWVRVYGWGPS